MYRILLSVAFVLMTLPVHAQQRVLDSLLTALANQPRNDTVRLNLLNDIAFAYKDIDPAKGLATADQAIRLATLIAQPVKLASAYMHKGLNHAAKGEDSLALTLYQQALRLHRQANNPSGAAKVLHNLGLIYQGQSHYLEALNHHQQAAGLFRQLGDQKRLAAVLNSVGVDYMYLNDYAKAVATYFDVLKLGERAGNKLSIAHALNNIGLIYKRMEQYDKALYYHRKALQGYRQADNQPMVASALSNMASAYDFLQQPARALDYYNQALTINRSTANQRGIASDLLNIGIVYHDQGQYGRALPYLQRSLRLYEQLGNKHSMNIALDYLGDWYAKAPVNLLKRLGVLPTHRYDKALVYQQQALRMAQEIGAIDLQSGSWENLSRTYAATGQYARSLAAYKRYVTLRDSVLNLENRTAIARKEMQFAFEKKQALALAEHAKRQAVTKAELKQQQTERNAALGGGGLLLIASAVGFVLYKRKRESDQHRKESELKAEIADTEMKALRAQMNPHFIFNSLNSISDYVVKNDTKTADYYLAKFAKLMRLILEHSEKKQVTLADDLQALELYMQLEALRMPHRFTYQIQVDDDLDPDETLIPPLLLQPFVENSIWHGLAWKEGAGKITIHIRRDGEMIHCIVEDNGVGRQRAQAAKTSTEIDERKSLGMKITTARIALMNQQRPVSRRTEASAVLLSDLAEGTRVEVKLPLELSF